MSLNDFSVGPVAAVSDMARAREFYESSVGLSVGDDPSDELCLYPCADGTALAIYTSPDHAGKSTATLVSWAVDDVEREVDELTASGVTFEQYDDEPLKTDEKGIIATGETKVAFFRDPDGNTHAINGS